MNDFTYSQFPNAYAETRRYTLGRPRNIKILPGGLAALFLRSAGPRNPVTSLWKIEMSLEGGLTESQLFNPGQSVNASTLTLHERLRRERARDAAEGILSYSVASNSPVVAFALSGDLYRVDLTTNSVRTVEGVAGADNPSPSPDGRYIAYVVDGGLRVFDHETNCHRPLAVPSSDGEIWATPDFISAEEIGRHEALWWSPDGTQILATRVSLESIPETYLSNPATPTTKPTRIRFPFAGGPNPLVELWLFDLSGNRIKANWNTDSFPYLIDVSWSEPDKCIFSCLSRDHKTLIIYSLDRETGTTYELLRILDPFWVSFVLGLPVSLPNGTLVSVRRSADRLALHYDDRVVSATLCSVRRFVSSHDGYVYFTATIDSRDEHLWLVDPDQTCHQLTTGDTQVVTAAARDGLVILHLANANHFGFDTQVLRLSKDSSSLTSIGRIQDFSEPTQLQPNVFFITGDIPAAVVLPRRQLSDKQVPVIVDSYGGPVIQRVRFNGDSFLLPQWFAEQGFGVVVIDNRGSPGRGLEWERAIHGRWAQVIVEDQVRALQEAASRFPQLDLTRVAIRGWSFGGYLAGLCVAERPDVFSCGVLGAPVSDWRMYDTFYSERYLGYPGKYGEFYDEASLLRRASNFRRPILIIHGLLDDNVLAMHSLSLCVDLFKHNKDFRFVPLVDASHVTSAKVSTAEALLNLELSFIKSILIATKGAVANRPS